jgi:hypothetical protein
MRTYDYHLRVRLFSAIVFTVNETRNYSNPINALSFSHDGEFLAAANTGMYIDIVSQIQL